MSTPSSAAAAATATSTNNLSTIGVGYAVVIALAFLVLLSSLILASYLCCRRRSRSLQNPNPNANYNNSTNPNSDGIIVPRVIFVAEDDEDQDGDNGSAAVGLDQAVINSYPKLQYSKDGWDPSNTTCSICLCEYKNSEMLRMMPECRHYFHLCCIDAWLRLNGSCPVCRNSPLPTPLSTPLSEVVPLSQYAADRRRR